MKKSYKILCAVVITTAFLISIPINIKHENTIITPQKDMKNEENIDKNKDIILSYKKVNATISDNAQVINILELKKNNHIYDVMPVLSQDSIYGFETTTSMARRKDADAAINGGFFYPYGQPSGIIIVDGDILSTPFDSQNRKIFIQDYDGNFYLEDLNFEYFIKVGQSRFTIDGVNREPRGNEIILFTRLYGTTNRLSNILTYNLLTENKYIKSTKLSKSQMNIPDDEFVVTATGTKINELKNFFYQNQNSSSQIEFFYNAVDFSNDIKYAFEGAFWVIKDEQVVINKNEPWVGLTTNREPRTAIGLKANGDLVLITVDGRQPGYSIGLSGKELAAYLLQYGITNSLMLDGGASTTMVVKGKLVNKPSYRNEERMIGGSICLIKQ